MNGGFWYDASHHTIDITGATEESSEGWRGVARIPLVSLKAFRVGADFSPDFAHAHINIKETFTLHEVLWLLIDVQPEYLQGSTVTIDVDNTLMFHSVRKGRTKDARMQRLACQFSWLQVEGDFTLKLRWVTS